MIDLEHALTDLAEHLDHPAGEQLVDDVRERLAPNPPRADRRPLRTRSWLAVAAVFLLVLATVIAVAPARHAIADWLGLGAVKIRQTETPPRTNGTTGNEVPGSTGARADADAAARLRAGADRHGASRSRFPAIPTWERSSTSRWMCACPVGSSR